MLLYIDIYIFRYTPFHRTSSVSNFFSRMLLPSLYLLSSLYAFTWGQCIRLSNNAHLYRRMFTSSQARSYICYMIRPWLCATRSSLPAPQPHPGQRWLWCGWAFLCLNVHSLIRATRTHKGTGTLVRAVLGIALNTLVSWARVTLDRDMQRQQHTRDSTASPVDKWVLHFRQP